MVITTTTVKRTAFFNFGFAGSARTLKSCVFAPLEEEEEALLFAATRVVVDATTDDDTTDGELIAVDVNIFIFAFHSSEEKRLEFSVNFFCISKVTF